MMTKRFYRAAALLPSMSGLALAGCVSMFEGTHQEITVATNPAEASCNLEREGRVIKTIERTPQTVTVQKSKYDITIKCNKPGYEEASYNNHSGVSPTIAANIVLDLLVTAGISSIVDSANGADNKYESAVVITLSPAPASDMASTGPITPASTAVVSPPASKPASSAVAIRVVEPLPPGPIDFKVARLGTRFYLTTGGFLEIASVDDKSVETVNAANRKTHWISLFVDLDGREAYQLDKSRLETLWPLEVGKKVQFDLSGAGTSTNGMGTWTNELRVLRTERVKVTAGEFETVVIEYYQRGIAGAGLGFIASTYYWYAPQAGFVVKRVYNLQQGSERSASWEVSRIETR